MRIALLFLLFLSVPSALAFGVSQDFHENSTIPVMRGSSVLHRLTLQNSLNQPLPVNVTLAGGYAHIDGRESLVVTVPAQSTNTVLFINITVPAGERAGTLLPHSYSVQPVVESAGMIAVGVRINDGFTVLVEENPGLGRSRTLLMFGFVGAAALLILLFEFVRLARRER